MNVLVNLKETFLLFLEFCMEPTISCNYCEIKGHGLT